MKCLSINYLQAQMKRRAGFTLIELLVVMSILAVLLGSLANKYSTAEQNKRIIKVDNDLKVIATAMLQYEQDSLTDRKRKKYDGRNLRSRQLQLQREIPGIDHCSEGCFQ